MVNINETIKKQVIIRQLRKTSQYELALQYIAQIKSLNQLTPGLTIEIIRIMLLTENYDIAAKYFNLFLRIFPKEQQVMDEEIFLRLSMNCKLENSSLSLLQTNYDWVKKYKKQGIDIVYYPEIQNCQVITTSGHTVYKFMTLCQSCKNIYRINVKGTLLIKKLYLCPFCLAKQLLTFENIKIFIEKQYPELINEQVIYKDIQFLKLREKVNFGYFDSSIPKLALYLNQDLIFALNQLIVNKILTAK